jgi:hypothetical protein
MLLHWVIAKNIPFNAIDCPEFQAIAKGHVPCRQILSGKNLDALYDTCVSSVISFIKEQKVKQFAITSDLWTARFSRVGYMGINLHFIDKNWIKQKVCFVFNCLFN